MKRFTTIQPPASFSREGQNALIGRRHASRSIARRPTEPASPSVASRRASSSSAVYPLGRASTVEVDALVIGGGPIGLSTAYHLAAMHRGCDGSGIVVVERDPTYARSSATLSAGGIRQQFSLKENVEMSLYGRDFLRRAHELLRSNDDDDDDEEEVDVQFQEHGYLFLAASEGGRDQLIRNNKTQRLAGCNDVTLLGRDELERKFPWLNTTDIVLGSYGERGEGWFDPWALIRGLKKKCLSMGVTFVNGRPVSSRRDAENDGGRVLSVDVLVEDRNVVRYNVNCVVNAAGAHCNGVMEILAGKGGGGHGLAHPIPVEPRKRCIFFIHCNTSQGDLVPKIAPLTVCPTSGVYFRSEGSVGANGETMGNFLCGVSPRRDVDRAIGDMNELDYADHQLWDDVIWPALYHRVPAFGDVKVKSSWAGLYEYNTIDQNAIIDFHPEMNNVIMANGFSGHGLQQSPAAGRAVSELISCDGRFESLDLSIFSFERICNNRPIFETGIV
ncbi:hypothetical protein ACHAXA_006786 [Cyclostephanos tholiformis]|uniref:FAD-dependent oxidoreductase domain-containing protein 1 n=1 Tax=Cyclostephanos tholiformis TaxID=382380 RepID=A0ABD3RJ99_9STRA